MEEHALNQILQKAPLLHFQDADEATLAALREQLGLTASDALLTKLNTLFQKTRHTPTAAELQLLDALAGYWPQYSTNAAVTALTFENEEEARIWQDMLRLYTANAKNATPPTLRALLSLSASALKVAGRYAEAPAPLCDTHAALTARFGDEKPRLSLTLGHVQLTLYNQEKTPKKPAAGLSLLAVRQALPGDRNDVIERFLGRYASCSPIAIAAIGEEGLGAHLPCLSYGVELELATIGISNVTELLSAVPNTVLIAMTPQHAAAALAEGAPATLIGRIAKTPQLTVRNGLDRLTCLPLSLLATWQLLTARAGLQPSGIPTEVEVPVTVTDGQTLLGGISYKGASLTPLLTLLHKIYTEGGDMRSARLCATLRLPKGSLTGAVAPLLAYHRFTAELALPTGNAKVLCDPTVSAPTLTVGLAAAKHKNIKNEAAPLLDALEKGDFSALRAAIYKTV